MNEFKHYLKTYVEPSPLFFAKRITNDLGGAKIYFKRDELNHTGYCEAIVWGKFY